MAFVLAMVVISHIQHYAADIYDDGRRDCGIVGQHVDGSCQICIILLEIINRPLLTWYADIPVLKQSVSTRN